jgi:hypothetical protein
MAVGPLYGRGVCVAVLHPLYGRQFIWTGDLSLLYGDRLPRYRHRAVSPLNPFILKPNPVSPLIFTVNHVSLSTTHHHQPTYPQHASPAPTHRNLPRITILSLRSMTFRFHYSFIFKLISSYDVTVEIASDIAL